MHYLHNYPHILYVYSAVHYIHIHIYTYTVDFRLPVRPIPRMGFSYKRFVRPMSGPLGFCYCCWYEFIVAGAISGPDCKIRSLNTKKQDGMMEILKKRRKPNSNVINSYFKVMSNPPSID